LSQAGGLRSAREWSRRGRVGAAAVWLASVREDVTLLVGEFLPEFLLVSLLLIVFWALRKRFRRDAHPTS
jgi:hypothetical protein